MYRISLSLLREYKAGGRSAADGRAHGVVPRVEYRYVGAGIGIGSSAKCEIRHVGRVAFQTDVVGIGVRRAYRTKCAEVKRWGWGFSVIIGPVWLVEGVVSLRRLAAPPARKAPFLDRRLIATVALAGREDRFAGRALPMASLCD